MLRNHLNKEVLSVARTWTSFFHSSLSLQESARKRSARMVKKSMVEERIAKAKYADLKKPHPALGTVPGDDTKWENCDLAKILLTEEQIHRSPPRPLDPQKPLILPEYFSFGIGESEKRILFDQLPDVAAQRTFLRMSMDQLPADLAKTFAKEQDKIEVQATANTNMLARIVDLRNANAAGIAYENRRRIVEAFSSPDKPGDTGRPEVQAALLTAKIRNLWHHLSLHKRDVHNKRSLRVLIHQRAKMLRYLRLKDRDRYDTVLTRLGIEPGAVEGEVVI